MIKKLLIKNRVFMFLVLMLPGISGVNSIIFANHDDLFPVIDGWEKPAEIDVYTPETLWDIINGAADLFYAYDFRELYWGEYINSEDNDTYIVVEIYRQGGPVRAFGVYSQERPGTPRLTDMGVQGYTAPGVLHFFVADSYVKIRSHDRSEKTAEAMKKIGRHISDTLDPNPEFPHIANYLPEEGKIEHSEEFINTNFLGHTFLSGAFVSTYDIEGNRFNLFIIENDNSKESEKILNDYYEFSKQDTEGLTEGIHRIDDRWNGEVGIVWKDNILYGYYNLDDEELQEKYLDLFSGR